ncbi:hypothetical protein [Microbacterium sp.]|uniref:hypothetical protein n=1 Tax=Microbacterium sp. TaxID=51671 RepID=UPI002BD17E59|nr:hypothetical protein [Microbacterium sp.]HWL75970.1 hypothetical protein [Microbacterium sp.]
MSPDTPGRVNLRYGRGCGGTRRVEFTSGEASCSLDDRERPTNCIRERLISHGDGHLLSDVLPSSAMFMAAIHDDYGTASAPAGSGRVTGNFAYSTELCRMYEDAMA